MVHECGTVDTKERIHWADYKLYADFQLCRGSIIFKAVHMFTWLLEIRV